MKGDFSRLRVDASKLDVAWLEQQGRVRVDSDANEAQLTRLLLQELESADTIGPFGAPSPGDGFKISAISNSDSFVIGGASGPGGRLYVDGILCRNATSQPYDQQA